MSGYDDDYGYDETNTITSASDHANADANAAADTSSNGLASDAGVDSDGDSDSDNDSSLLSRMLYSINTRIRVMPDVCYPPAVSPAAIGLQLIIFPLAGMYCMY